MERYKLRDFAKWARKAGLTDSALSKALDEMAAGLLGDRLGANVFKKRVALPGQGKRGATRAIVIFKKNDVAVFLYGYSKKEKSDLTSKEEEQLRTFSKAFLRLDSIEREARCLDGSLIKLKES